MTSSTTNADAHTLTGGCFCGAVRDEAAGARCNQSICDCLTCRRTSGAPMVAWFSVPRDTLRFVYGQPRTFRSSDHASRSFCAACGTPITFADDNLSEEIDIATCTLDDPEPLGLADHIFARSQVSWVRLADHLPRYVTTRAAGDVL